MNGLCNLELITWQLELAVTDGLFIKQGAENKVSSPTREFLGIQHFGKPGHIILSVNIDLLT